MLRGAVLCVLAINAIASEGFGKQVGDGAISDVQQLPVRDSTQFLSGDGVVSGAPQGAATVHSVSLPPASASESSGGLPSAFAGMDTLTLIIVTVIVTSLICCCLWCYCLEEMLKCCCCCCGGKDAPDTDVH